MIALGIRRSKSIFFKGMLDTWDVTFPLKVNPEWSKGFLKIDTWDMKKRVWP